VIATIMLVDKNRSRRWRATPFFFAVVLLVLQRLSASALSAVCDNP